MTTIIFETKFKEDLPDDKAEAVIAVIETYINTITKLIPTPAIHAGVSETPERRKA